jgi:hypothetical protein
MQRKKTKMTIKLPYKAWNKKHHAKVQEHVVHVLPHRLSDRALRSPATPVEIIANRLTRVTDAKAKRQLRNLHARARALISLEMA